MEYKKKLIEVALPLEAINAASAREKSIRHGHPSTLHLWWARRPLAAARAVIWASLVDDPSSHPDQFPTEEEQQKERERLFEILEKLVLWENTNNQEVLDEAKTEILKSTDGNPPALYDPFAGGGAIPLEAQRLGLEAHASDLNPVAVMINKAMIEIPPKFTGQNPVNPEARRALHKDWPDATGLAEDVRYYGEWMKEEAFKRIGHLYPTVTGEHGREHTVIAWIWARTVKCPNPMCGCEMPLATTFELSKKKNREVYVRPIVEGKRVHYKVEFGSDAPEPPKISRGANFKCVCCGEMTTQDYIRAETIEKRTGHDLIGIVAEDTRGRIYFSPEAKHSDVANVSKPDEYPSEDIVYNPRDFRPPFYGLNTYGELFTNRQLVLLTTLQKLLEDTRTRIGEDISRYANDQSKMKEYGDAISVYLAFLVDKICDYNSMLCTWHNSKELIRNTFSRQAVGITWDYSEANPFSRSSGSISNMLSWITKSIVNLPSGRIIGFANQHDAQSDAGMREIMISTDPPYYNNIAYADLSNYFYVWLRRSLKALYPNLFSTILVPQTDELVANPFLFEGSDDDAQKFFERGMYKAFTRIGKSARQDIPITVYYAYKQSDSDTNGDVASTGWESMLAALMRAELAIVGTWPIRTEMANRTIASGANALASSIVLVCRKRSIDAPNITRRDFVNTLKRELRAALRNLQASNIAPVDMAQSAIGPGMGIYSSFSKILEADGSPMSVRTALEIINQELDLYFADQDGELDADSRFCIDLYSQYAFNDIKFGDADVLARAKNTSVDRLASRGLVYSQKGVVRLTTREDLPKEINTKDPTIWLLTQQLTHALEVDGVLGVANIVAGIFTSEPERAKDLAYRLFTLAERKSWSSEAYAYNSLVIAWPEVQMKVAELKSQAGQTEQLTIKGIN